MNGLGAWVDKQNYRQAVRQAITKAVAQANAAYAALPKAQQTLARKQELIRQQVQVYLSHSALSKADQQQLQQAVNTFIETMGTALIEKPATAVSQEAIQDSIVLPSITRSLKKQNARHRRLGDPALSARLQKSRAKLIQSLETYAGSKVESPTEIKNWREHTIQFIQESSLPVSATKRVIKRIHKVTGQLLGESKKASAKPKGAQIAVYAYGGENGQKGTYLTSWHLGQDAPKLQAGQEAYLVLSEDGKRAEMFVVRSKSNGTLKDEKPMLVRSDITLTKAVSRSPETSRFGMKKVLEGFLLINNRIWPILGVYLIAGMGNLSTTVSPFAKGAFSLNSGEMFIMGGLSSVIMGFLSPVVGILQNHWSKTKDGRVNGQRGRKISMNIGLLAMGLGFALPMLGGMTGNLGDPLAFKKYLLLGSFVFLGVGAAFMDVSMKPTVLAASMAGEYQARQGYFSVFKQTVGNMSNYVVPPLVTWLLSLFGQSADWTVYFPIYTAILGGVFVAYNLAGIHQQTLEDHEFATKEKRLNIKNMFKEFVGPKAHNRIVRHGVLATAMQGASMGILGLFVNSMFKSHFEQLGFAVETGHWLLPSLVAFTAPIILGRTLGTALMKKEIRLGNHTIKPLQSGT